MTESEERELRRLTHKTIKKVNHDLERFRFNTMLAALMEFTNYLANLKSSRRCDSLAWREALDSLLLLLAPTAPHLAEELWTRTGHPYSIHNQKFPTWDEELTREEEFTLIIQINGKVRDKVSVPTSITEDEVVKLALSRERVKLYLNEKKVLRTIYVPHKLVNIVTG